MQQKKKNQEIYLSKKSGDLSHCNFNVVLCPSLRQLWVNWLRPKPYTSPWAGGENNPPLIVNWDWSWDGSSGLILVLKCTWDIVFFFLGVARPAHQETIAIEKIVCYPQFPRGGGHVPLCRAMWGNTRKQEEKAWADAFTVASEGRNGWGRINSWMGLGLDSLNNLNSFGGFWAIGWSLVVWYRTLGWIRQGIGSGTTGAW